MVIIVLDHNMLLHNLCILWKKDNSTMCNCMMHQLTEAIHLNFLGLNLKANMSKYA